MGDNKIYLIALPLKGLAAGRNLFHSRQLLIPPAAVFLPQVTVGAFAAAEHKNPLALQLQYPAPQKVVQPFPQLMRRRASILDHRQPLQRFMVFMGAIHKQGGKGKPPNLFQHPFLRLPSCPQKPEVAAAKEGIPLLQLSQGFNRKTLKISMQIPGHINHTRNLL